MITDAFLTLTTPNATAAGDYASVDVIDTQQIGADTANNSAKSARDWSSGHQLFILITIPATWVGGTNAVFTLQGGPNADKSSGGYVATLTNTLIRASGHLDGGRQYRVAVPTAAIGSLGTKLPRYIWVQATTTGTFTGSTNTSIVNILLDVQDGKTFYSSGFTV
jgi:hypothetical protein